MVGPIRNSASSGVPTTSGTSNGVAMAGQVGDRPAGDEHGDHHDERCNTLRCQRPAAQVERVQAAGDVGDDSIGRLRFQMSVVGA